MRNSVDYAKAFVVAVTLVTFYLWHNAEENVRLFLGACLIAQLATLIGLSTRYNPLIFLGHVAFLVSMWLGSWLLTNVELGFVAILCAVVLASRRWFDGCLLSQARGENNTWDSTGDLLYALPLIVSACRMGRD
jgi:hypothetical protein